MTVGRKGATQNFPTDARLGNTHFRVTLQNNRVYVEDLHTESGTRVCNGRIAPGTPQRLNLHEPIEAGEQLFILTNQDKETPSLSSGHHEYTYVTAVKTIALDKSAPTLPAERPHPLLRDEPAPIQESTEPALALETKAPPTEDLSSRSPIRGFLIVGSLLLAGYVVFNMSPEFAKTRSKRSPEKVASTEATPEKKDGPVSKLLNWRVESVADAPGVLFLKNTKIFGERPLFQAMKDSRELLARFFRLPQNGHNQFLLEQPLEMEQISDEACELFRAGRSPPETTYAKILEDIGAGSPTVLRELSEESPGQNPALKYSARLLSLRYPMQQNQPQISSYAIQCSDPAGLRFTLSMTRATPFHMNQARAVLSAKLAQHEEEILKTVSKQYAQEANKGLRLAALIKGFRNLSKQNLTFRAWAAGTGQTDLVALSDGISETLSLSIEDFKKKYDYGRFVYPVYYPEIPDDAVLLESDLLFLAAY